MGYQLKVTFVLENLKNYKVVNQTTSQYVKA